MIDKETFRRTEARLYNYYKQLKVLEKIKCKIELLKMQKNEIEKEMQNLSGLTLEVYANMGIDYSRDKIQTTSTGVGESERETIKYITRMEKERDLKTRDIMKCNARMREIEVQTQDMEYNLSMLNEECRRFIEWKYAESKSIEWVAEEMYLGSRATAYRKRDELVEGIAQWSGVSL